MIWTHEKLKVKEWSGQPARYKQYKFNGHRFTIFKSADGTLVGTERKNVTSELRPHIKDYEWWKTADELMPPTSSIDGELYVPFGNAGDAAHAIAEGTENLEFMPFAVPWWNSMAISMYDLECAAELVKPLGFAPFFPMYEHDTFEQLLYDAEQLGIEGWVLKELNYYGWYKVKPTKTADCIVTGFKDGNGKYLGLVGSLKVSAYVDDKLTEVASISGFDDITRCELDEESDLGRVCEVEYQEIGNRGRLIHPRFIRWRDDKPESECVLK